MNKTTTTTASEKENVKAFSADILSNSIEANSILACGQVKYAFRNHYVNLATDESGIEALLVSIFQNKEAVFALADSQMNSPLRQVVISGSFYSEELHEFVVEIFGDNRYPLETIRHYLSNLLSRDRKLANGSSVKAIVGKVKLDKTEDLPRPCPRPRCKWFLLNTADHA